MMELNPLTLSPSKGERESARAQRALDRPPIP